MKQIITRHKNSFKVQAVLFIYLFLKILFILREKGREGEKEGETWTSYLSHAPYWGPGLKPRPVP